MREASNRLRNERRSKVEANPVLSAIRTIWQQLSLHPFEFGEPLYRLPALRLQVRHGAIGPLLVYFAVHEEEPLVFIKGVNLLPEQAL